MIKYAAIAARLVSGGCGPYDWRGPWGLCLPKIMSARSDDAIRIGWV
jgi:hypothetical protein